MEDVEYKNNYPFLSRCENSGETIREFLFRNNRKNFFQRDK